MNRRALRVESDDIVNNLRQQSNKIEQAVDHIERARQSLLQYESPSNKTLQTVTKTIYQGPRGGLYYVNDNGNKVYLTPGQCARCVDGNLRSAQTGCPPTRKRKTKCQPSRRRLKKTCRSRRSK